MNMKLETSCLEKKNIQNILQGWRNKNSKCEAFLSCSSSAWITQGDTYPDMNENIVSWSYIMLECFILNTGVRIVLWVFMKRVMKWLLIWDQVRISNSVWKWLKTKFFHSYYKFIQSENLSNGIIKSNYQWTL